MAQIRNVPTDAERAALLASIDWKAVDAITDDDIARQIAADPDVAPDLSAVPAQDLRVHHPPGGVNVRGIRAKLGLTAAAFATRFGFPLEAVRNWENGHAQPDDVTRTLLLVIDENPDLVARVVERSGEAA